MKQRTLTARFATADGHTVSSRIVVQWNGYGWTPQASKTRHGFMSAEGAARDAAQGIAKARGWTLSGVEADE
jgi:hypothetical protein